MKKIVLIISMFLLCASVVSASSINGDYNGNPIVIVKSQGKALETDEVPAMIYDGHTLVPISLLRQIGASVDWDADTYSVNVALPQTAEHQTIPDIKKLQADLNDEVAYIEYTASSLDDYTQLSLSLKFDVFDPLSLTKYQKVFGSVGYSNVRQIRLVDQSANGYIYFIKSEDMKQFLEAKITSDELNNRIEIHPKINNKTQGNIQNNTQVPQSSQVVPATKNYPSLYSNDGKIYLGKLTTNEYDADSIFNEYGTFGSTYSATSIWNEFGDYGSEFSSKSAFNEFTSTPPQIVLDGKVIGYLTANSTIKGAISPVGLKESLKKLGY